jgi:hypothetical protein
MTISMKQTLADRANIPDDLVASGRQIDMMFKRGQKTLSLRAQKIWHLLVKSAGVRLGDDVIHDIPLAAFYDVGHMTVEARLDAIRELQTTLVEVTKTLEDGKIYVVSGPLVSFVARAIDETGALKWGFSPALRMVFADSDHWAILSKRAVMAFESRYSLRLYEIVALRSGLDHKISETFDLETLRDRLGVPVGKMTTWSHFRQFSLDPAIEEVNHLAGFTVSYQPIKRGRAVVAIKLSWGKKTAPERKATKRELDNSKIGRKARRAGAVETVVEPPKSVASSPSFPADGSIAYGKWAELVRKHAPHPTPDVDLVASSFRKWAAGKNLPLDAVVIEARFVTFCNKFRN